MDDLVRADAAVVGDDVARLAVVVERDLARLCDIHALRDGRGPRLRDGHVVRARGDVCRELIELLEELIAHHIIREPLDARELRQRLIGEHRIARRVRDAVRRVVVVERHRRRLVDVHGDVCAVRQSAEAVVLRPAAVDGNLILIVARGQLLRVAVEIMPQGLHARRHVAGVPVLRGACLRLHRARHDDGAALSGERLLLRLHALVGDRDLVRRLVVGERHIVVRREAQRRIGAARLAVLAVVDIPTAADRDLEVVVALLEVPDIDAVSLAVRLHDRRAVRRIPVLRRAERRLQRTDEHDVILRDRRSRLRDRRGERRQLHLRRCVRRSKKPERQRKPDGTAQSLVPIHIIHPSNIRGTSPDISQLTCTSVHFVDMVHHPESISSQSRCACGLRSWGFTKKNIMTYQYKKEAPPPLVCAGNRTHTARQEHLFHCPQSTGWETLSKQSPAESMPPLYGID